MNTIAIVVLHYENLHYTKRCIDSIIKCWNSDRIKIVVVDNGSKIQTLDELERIYEDDNIIFLYSKTNQGFAKGNNIGFSYAKTKYSPDIIILSNNDIIIEQRDFFEVLSRHYDSDRFDVAGPSIISLIDGKNQNPVPILYKDIKEVNKRMVKFWIMYVLSYAGVDAFARKLFSNEIMEYYPSNHDEFQLHGAFLIFGGGFIKEFDGLFDKTFMYNEESILYDQVKKHGMKLFYYQDLTVFHEEGGSTNSFFGKGKKARQFYYKWNIHSCRILRQIKKGYIDC